MQIYFEKWLTNDSWLLHLEIKIITKKGNTENIILCSRTFNYILSGSSLALKHLHVITKHGPYSKSTNCVKTQGPKQII